MRTRRWLGTCAVWCCAAAAGVAAQDSVIVIRPKEAGDTLGVSGPPAEVVRELLAIYNDTSTARLVGSFTLPVGVRLQGPVALFRGTLRVLGRIDGPVTVINGDLVVGSGGVVAGEVLVVGGRVEVRPGGDLAGTPRVYSPAAPLYRTGGGLLAIRERPRPLSEIAAARASFQAGKIRTTLSLETGRTYNRVEGLPIVFGPTFTGNALPTLDARLDVRGIFRPAADRTNLRDDLGFLIQSEWRVGQSHWLAIGGRGYRVIGAIEDQPLSRGEAGWSAFLLQRDYRDHYEVRGQEAYVTFAPVRRLRLGASIRRDDERSVRASDPVSLFRNSETWRPNPLIDDGHFQTAQLRLDWDTRNDTQSPTSGWLVHGRVEHSSSDDAAPVALPSAVRPPLPPGHSAFSKLWVDARRYARFNPAIRVNARVVGGGWIDGDPLSVQRRISLGGPDILPGFDFRALNCAPAGFRDPALTALCDRLLAVQLELRTRISLNLPFRITSRDFSTLERIIGIQQADLVVFGNSGTAWLSGDGPGRVPSDRIPVLREWKGDAGLGVDAGGLGIYLAKSFTDNVPLKLVLRLQRRF